MSLVRAYVSNVVASFVQEHCGPLDPCPRVLLGLLDLSVVLAQNHRVLPRGNGGDAMLLTWTIWICCRSGDQGARCRGSLPWSLRLRASSARALVRSFAGRAARLTRCLAGGATPAAPTILGRQTSRLSWPQRRRPEQLGCNLAAVGPAPLLATRTPWPTCRART